MTSRINWRAALFAVGVVIALTAILTFIIWAPALSLGIFLVSIFVVTMPVIYQIGCSIWEQR